MRAAGPQGGLWAVAFLATGRGRHFGIWFHNLFSCYISALFQVSSHFEKNVWFVGS